ncbi:sensor histidine kinase [Photobacterium sanguinicancri]|uniref:sensor histidine kinase n=1 Tax=Photobacterium sanguinicancri TaxID=875932 RepID=UPI0026E2849E|nr:HAMP domain-containing sensor histidine kinase [Photobacterium sanguinicancri]MDO6496772.1 HAMP domain-containing sensor histidine kinase [Photobacterium sanguinicancri]
MKINQSLLRIVLTFIISTILILILGYSLLARSFYLWGLDNSLAMNAIHIQKIISEQGFNSVEPKLDIIDTELYRSYQELPTIIQQTYSPNDLNALEHYSFEVKDAWYDYPDSAYFVHPAIAENGVMYFIVNTFDDQFLVPEFERIEDDMPSILVVSIIAISILLLLGLSLVQYIARPVNKLHQWAQELTLKTLATPVPEFGFRELDELAEKIHNNLQSIEKTLSRESQFLQHASHELRTPIAVILSNASLMEHLWHDAPPACQKPLKRINRAGLTMSHLTETLLWLTRNKDYQPKIETFNLSQLTEELVEEHQYLLGGKDVTVELALSPVTQSLPKVMIRIIIANVIRNAMQHTDSGHILIKLEQETLTIVNWGELLKGEKSDGFGLGIKLVKQICNNQDWHYQQDVTDNACTVKVIFNKSVK